jgi:hypothetical protein
MNSYPGPFLAKSIIQTQSLNISNIPVNMIERLEVYKGVVPVWLGTDALSGAVNKPWLFHHIPSSSPASITCLRSSTIIS